MTTPAGKPQKIDLRTLKHGQTGRKGFWLITRVFGGYIYREYTSESTSMVFVPMSQESMFSGDDWELDIA